MKTKLISFIFVVVILCSQNYVNAAFLQNVPQKITQPTGQILECFATGDEFYNWLHDADEYTIIQNPETRFYVYADKIDDELVPTNLIFGIHRPETLNLQKRLIATNNLASNELRSAFEEALKIQFLERENRLKKLGDQLQAQRTINNIIIFVEFADASFTKTDLTAYEKEYNTDALSMRSYFEEVSYGNCIINSLFFPVSNDGKIKAFKLQRNRGYLLPQSAQNPQGYSNNGDRMLREKEILEEVIRAIKPEISVNLDVDSDNDGWLDALTIICQGDATTNSALWPHALSGGLLTTETINGKRIRNFNLLLETLSDFGVATHEMGHILGAPDFYTYDNIAPVEYWDVMSNGNYAMPEIPHFMMHLKQKYYGWIDDIPEITQAGTYILNPVTSATNNAYKIRSPYSEDEYFLLEYRRHIDSRFGGNGLKNRYPQNNGLLIYRVVPSVNGNLNSVANGRPYEVYVYRPNGTPTINGNVSQAAFSDEYSRIAINDNTNPSAFLSTGANGGLDISNIQLINNGEQIQFGITIPPRYYDLIVLTGGGVGTTQTNPSPSTNILSGTEITLTANPAANYELANWTDKNNTILSTENPYTIKLTRNRTITANFVMTGPTIVLNENDNGWGSLRQVVTDAPNRAIITFADTVNHITLTSAEIKIIDKSLTIDGGSNTTKKITIDGNNRFRIFNTIRTHKAFFYDFVNINNIKFINGYTTSTSGGVVGSGGAMNINAMINCTTINCIFEKNLSVAGGAVYNDGIFKVENCRFVNNFSVHSGGAVDNTGTFIAINSTFDNNTAEDAFNFRSGVGGAVCNDRDFIAINCTFANNDAIYGGAIGSGYFDHSPFPGYLYLYHCTFDNNTATNNGAGIHTAAKTINRLFSYNCIYTGTNNQIQGSITAGDNLREGIGGVTRNLVFEDNKFDSVLGYITPLPYATTATWLTNATNFEVPNGITKNEILEKLATDQAVKQRPYLSFSENDNVTFGSIEATITPPVAKTFTLTLNTNTGGTTHPKGVTIRDSGEVVEIVAVPENCYRFLYWTDENDAVFSEENPLFITMISDTILVANFEYICDTIDVKFTIRADTHQLVSPSARNYRVPIYITADEDISGTTIEKLVLEIDRNIYFPRNIINNNGTMSRNFTDSVLEITIENITVPELKAGVESILLTIRGDIILGNKDSSLIKLKEVIFANELSEYPELIDGYITINICEAGSDRFLVHKGHSPSITITPNPPTDMLEVECKVIESGYYTIEIVDVLGKAAIVKEWSVNANDEQEYNFTIPLLMYGNGSYFLILNTPSAKYSEKFIVEK
ncbi:MAG: T9SS type A sorting domain-containing protein [Bacteroidetes bacterium]|nr:T9SS type A sorting domain-containing protein [Bacteroidota bacterium]